MKECAKKNSAHFISSANSLILNLLFYRINKPCFNFEIAHCLIILSNKKKIHSGFFFIIKWIQKCMKLNYIYTMKISNFRHDRIIVKTDRQIAPRLIIEYIDFEICAITLSLWQSVSTIIRSWLKFLYRKTSIVRALVQKLLRWKIIECNLKNFELLNVFLDQVSYNRGILR